jgi:ribosomal protein L11 methyltransferase
MQRFVCVRARVLRGAAERVVAESWAAGARGLEERDQDPERTLLLLYAPAERGAAVCEAARRAAGRDGDIGPPEPVVEREWREDWKRGLGPIAISPRLVVRPPFAPYALGPGQRELVIEPGQAFGTGAHASTRLALELLDASLAETGPVASALDLGTGSGVLVLAALRLGVRRAVGLDLDPVAAAEARRNARANRLDGRLLVVAGPLEALRAGGYDLVLANLLRSELAPVLADLAGRLAPNGRAVVSGLLASEQERLAPDLERARLRVLARRTREEGPHGERWLALLTSR